MTELAFPEIDAPRADVATIPTATLKDTALASFVPIEQHMRTLAARFKDVAYDVTTPRGMKDAKAARLVLRDEGRYAVQRLQKRLKDEANDLKRTLDSKADELIAITKPVEDAIDGQITVHEEKLAAEKAERERIERERVAALEAKLAGLSAWIERCKAPGMTSERIALGIDALKILPIGDDWAEFKARAEARKAEVLDVMCDMGLAAEAREVEAARLEAQRLESERIAAEQRAEAERLAAERRALAELAAALAAERAESERLLRQAEEVRLVALAELRRQEAQELIKAKVASERLAEILLPADGPYRANPPTPPLTDPVPGVATTDETDETDSTKPVSVLQVMGVPAAQEELNQHASAVADAILDEPFTLKLGDLCAKFEGLGLSAAFITDKLGVPFSFKAKNAIYYTPTQGKAIKAKLLELVRRADL